MDVERLAALLTPEGQAVLIEAAAADLSEAGLLTAATRLRERHPADLVAAALTQVRLRTRAHEKFGPDADRMYFTHTGLEQSTRAPVATHRARRFATLAGHEPTLELGCGIGGDLIARARAGRRSEAVEQDPLTAAVARANLAALGLAEVASVRLGDATKEDPADYAAVFADPGRRTARGRVFDPKAYEPPLDVVLDLARRAPAACVKVAPGIPHEVVPDGAEAEWISVGGDVKEAALWLGELAGEAGHRATLIRGDQTETLTPEGIGPPAVRAWGRFLYEPDGAVIRAGLVAEVAAQVDGGLADEHIAYITADRLVPTPFASAYEIEDALPFSVKRIRALLRARGVGVLTIKKRGSAVDIDQLRHRLGFAKSRPGAERTLILTRVGQTPTALLAKRPQ